MPFYFRIIKIALWFLQYFLHVREYFTTYTWRFRVWILSFRYTSGATSICKEYIDATGDSQVC